MKIFISYAAQDEQPAAKVRDHLNDAGLSTWMDSGAVKPGKTWRARLEQELDSADAGVLLLSNAALNSPLAAFQYKHFLAAKKPLIVAALEPLSIMEIPASLIRVPRIDLTQDFQKHLDELILAVQDILETPKIKLYRLWVELPYSRKDQLLRYLKELDASFTPLSQS